LARRARRRKPESTEAGDVLELLSNPAPRATVTSNGAAAASESRRMHQFHRAAARENRSTEWAASLAPGFDQMVPPDVGISLPGGPDSLPARVPFETAMMTSSRGTGSVLGRLDDGCLMLRGDLDCGLHDLPDQDHPRHRGLPLRPRSRPERTPGTRSSRPQWSR